MGQPSCSMAERWRCGESLWALQATLLISPWLNPGALAYELVASFANQSMYDLSLPCPHNPKHRGPFHALQRALPLCAFPSYDGPSDTQVLLQKAR
jgi:hypothetical protein